MHWKGLTPNPDENFGFVYVITHKETGITYIGKKAYWKMLPKRKRPLKGPTMDKSSPKWRDDCWESSDWRMYNSSSKKLKLWIAKEGEDKFDYQILSQYTGSRDLRYGEVSTQWERRVLEDPKCINGNIDSIRFRVEPLPKF